MASARVTVIRSSLALNLILMLYLAFTWLSHSPSHHIIQPRRESLLSLKEYEILDQVPVAQVFVEKDEVVSLGGGNAIGKTLKETALIEAALPSSKSPSLTPEKADVPPQLQEEEANQEEPPRQVQESAGVTELQMLAAPLVEEPPDPPLNSQERKMYPDLRDCFTRPLRQFYYQKGDYWILENYIPAVMTFRCDESITYTTHADYTFLDNLDPLTSRWQGPVSVSVYAPGSDFEASVYTILYLRECWAEGIKKYVTFHLFFHVNHTPKQVPKTETLLTKKIDCSAEPPKWVNVTTYRQQKKLMYPVNVGRNVARLASQTHFVFPSDVELYPSTNFIPEFFKMLKRPDKSNTTNPRVYVFSIFEVMENVSAPETKSELVKMLKTNIAVPFHKYVCPKCHNIPKSKEWLEAPVPSGLSVFHISKRKTPYHSWEPIYVGTNKEPTYDERLSWEGKSDKMTQMYILCVRDYEFHILDNAFLVHRPGIKHFQKEPTRLKIAVRQSSAIKSRIFPQYKIMFGWKSHCLM